ncbi:winged helix-turn-helix domain-containing protein [Stutzerimonas zhaodongensis]|uniref:winged helix-turn-helix domain-containing protein n=1 Tax=Stutzerimonas zhaodongensis TaxID=1176257 RepID=UPI0039F0BC6D
MSTPRTGRDSSDKIPRTSQEAPIRFGPFTLYTQQHVLMCNGVPLTIGSRALDLLICMAKRPGELLEKYELIAMAWPRTVVAECNLRAQIVAVRRVLKDKDPHHEYITNIPGRGYRFTAHAAQQPVHSRTQTSTIVRKPLPPRNPAIVGREDLIARLTEQLRNSRFVTLTGAGGVGKTTVAIEVAHRLEDEFPDGVLVFELFDYLRLEGILATLIESLGLRADAQSNLDELFGQLGGCRLLLVIDNCEQAVGAVAKLAETILRWAPNCAILATSREALRADGEMIERIEPLALSPLDRHDAQALAKQSPAIRLFIQHSQIHNPNIKFKGADLETVSDICAKLDGMPLDIEIAAERAASLPLEMLNQLLDMEFRLQMHSERDCERQRSLRASLDWSYDALPAYEQQLISMLSVTRGSFTLNAVLALVEDDSNQSPEHVLTALDSLVEKSLLTVNKGSEARSYQMLETTRLYGMEKLHQSGQFQRVSAQHAAYAVSVLQGFAERLEASAPEAWEHLYGAESETVKAALSWAVSDKGNQLLGLDLTLAALGLARGDS